MERAPGDGLTLVAGALGVPGAVLLIISPFLDWYGAEGEAVSGWNAFEVQDILLTGLAVLVLVQVLRALALKAPVRESLLPLAGGAALVIVVVQLVNFPPVIKLVDDQVDVGLEVGAWLGLVGAVLLASGGFVELLRRYDVMVSPREGAGPTSPAAGTPVPPPAPAPPPAGGTTPPHGDPMPPAAPGPDDETQRLGG